MPEILINVINKIPQLSGDVRQITADNADYTIRFVFDDDWNDGEKRVLFVRESGFAYPVGLTEKDTVAVPAVTGVRMRTALYIGVQQGVVKTSRPCMIPVYHAITDMIDDNAVQPDPSLWEDIVSRLETLEESGVTMDKIEEAVGDYLAKNPIEGVKPGNALEMIGDTLNVITTDEAEQDNTLPITSAGVHTIVGNISAILDTI